MQWWCAAQGVPWAWRWQAYPGVWLGLAVKPLAAPLARCVRGVDEVVEDAGTAEAFAGKIRAFAPDLLVSVAPGGRTGWCAFGM